MDAPLGSSTLYMGAAVLILSENIWKILNIALENIIEKYYNGNINAFIMKTLVFFLLRECVFFACPKKEKGVKENEFIYWQFERKSEKRY